MNEIRDIKELKQELEAGLTSKLYIFMGNELALQDVYINKIQEISKLKLTRADSLCSIKSNLFANSLFKVDPKLFVIRNDEEYFKAKESSWERFVKADNFKGNIVILTYTNVEDTTKFYKYHSSIITEFEYIGLAILRNRLEATTALCPQFCEELVKLCGCNYGRIKNELYKLQVYARVNKLDWNTAFQHAKEQKMIHEEIGDVIFDFTDAIITRNIKKAYEMYDKVIQTEDGTLRLLTVLYNNVRNLLQVQSTNIDKRTPENLGLTKPQIYVVGLKCGKYTLSELVYMLKLLRKIEKGIKVGEIEEKYAIPYFMGIIW